MTRFDLLTKQRAKSTERGTSKDALAHFHSKLSTRPVFSLHSIDFLRHGAHVRPSGHVRATTRLFPPRPADIMRKHCHE